MDNRIIAKNAVVSQIYGMLRTYLHILPIDFDMDETVDDLEPEEKIKQQTTLQSSELAYCNNINSLDMSFRLNGSGIGKKKVVEVKNTEIDTDKIREEKDAELLTVEGDMKGRNEDEKQEGVEEE